MERTALRPPVSGDRKPSSGGFKRALMDLIVRHGKVKAVGVKKPVSNRTQEWREQALFLMFAQLKEMGHKLESPHGFREAHLKRLVARWEEEDLSPATIQNRISVARTFSGWIGKPGMIHDSVDYVKDARKVKRQTAAVQDKSWSAAGVDVERMIAFVYATDKHVAMQMRLMAAFGLRREEAVMFKPHRADHGHYIIVRDGTKGGRERSVDVASEHQRVVLDAAKAMVKKVDGHVGHPDRNLKQALRRFNYVMEIHGLTRRQLGVTSHGLRHQRLNDLYEEIAGIPSPVRQSGMDPAVLEKALSEADPMKIDLARARVSSDAGHNRLSISSAYTGSQKPVKKPALNWRPEGMKREGAASDWYRLSELDAKENRNADEEAEFSMLKNRLMPGKAITSPVVTNLQS